MDENGYLGSCGKPIHLVNTRENGTFIQPRSLQHTNRVIRKELNMPLFDFHTLRHPYVKLKTKLFSPSSQRSIFYIPPK